MSQLPLPSKSQRHTSDAVEGYLLLAECMDDDSIRGRGFNLGTGEPVSVLDLTHRLARIMERTDLELALPGLEDEFRLDVCAHQVRLGLVHERPARPHEAGRMPQETPPWRDAPANTTVLGLPETARVHPSRWIGRPRVAQ